MHLEKDNLDNVLICAKFHSGTLPEVNSFHWNNQVPHVPQHNCTTLKSTMFYILSTQYLKILRQLQCSHAEDVCQSLDLHQVIPTNSKKQYNSAKAMHDKVSTNLLHIHSKLLS